MKKEIYSVKNWKEAFWENAVCSVSTYHRVTALRSRSLSLRLFLCNLQWYWEAHRGLWWIRKSLQLQTGKKLSKKRLCVLLIHLTELQLSPQKPFAKTVLVKFGKWYLKPIEGYGEKEISSGKNGKETFWETALCSANLFHSVTAFASRSLLLTLFLWHFQSYIWKPIEGYGEKGNIFR